MIISVVAAKIWYLKNVQFLLGHPVYTSLFRQAAAQINNRKKRKKIDSQ